VGGIVRRMAPTPTTEMRAALGQNSYVSLGLVAALVTGAIFYGRQLERLDAIDKQLSELSAEVREFRSLVVRQQSTGR
jgi:hypothetical protein